MPLSIIIINHNTFQLTCNCIRSIKEKLLDLTYEIVLVNNASTERDPQEFLKLLPEIKLIASKENTGFIGGDNMGIAAAQDEYHLLMNGYTELINNASKFCYDYIQRLYTATGSRHDFGATTLSRWKDPKTCSWFRTIGWELLEAIPLYKLLPKKWGSS